MKQIVKLIDVDVDGCGTNVETMIEIEGKQELTNGIIQRTKDAIEKYKKENDGEYDTDIRQTMNKLNSFSDMQNMGLAKMTLKII